MRIVSGSLTAAAFLSLAATAEARVRIEVDLGSQTMHVSANGGEYDWAVSTGRAGHRTPTGAYGVQRMYTMVHSAKYDNAPMPHAIFFTGGYAIHATYSTGALGRPASHGCVRLAPENAAALFEMVKHEGASIVITGQAPGGEVAAVRERHRGGQRLVAQWRNRYRDDALSYAPPPRRHSRPLRDWVNNPMESW